MPRQKPLSLETIQRMNRDNFDPGAILMALRDGLIPETEVARLLEEGCHAFVHTKVIINRVNTRVDDLVGILSLRLPCND